MSKIITSAKGLVLISVDEQKAGQDALKANLQTVDQQVHKWGVQALFHASVHGDTSLMRRLLIDVIDETGGYRRQAIINWMRKHSPMELVGKDIKLTGMITSDAQRDAMLKMFADEDPALFVVGERRPFLVDAADANMAVKDPGNKEMVKPVFQATLLSPIFAVKKKINAAMENTVDGKPVDASKYYFDGKNGDAIVAAMDEIQAILDKLPADVTKELREAQTRIKQDVELVESLGGKVELAKEAA